MITGSRAGLLIDALTAGYRNLQFDEATDNDQVFYQLMLTRIIEPTSKDDSLRVLDEAGVAALSYRTMTRRLPLFAGEEFRKT